MKIIVLLVLFSSLSLASQNKIRVSNGSVTCICDTSKTQLQIFRDSTSVNGQEVIGSYTKDSKSLTFTPFIPFMMEGKYTVVCGNLIKTFTIPVPKNYEFAEVKGVYPSTNELPANLLKFNIEFSKRMSAIANEGVCLLDSQGEVIYRALLSDIPELWNNDRTILTVWIEPGRIKRGLGPNERLGPVLEVKKEYSLVISRNLRDANGVKVKSDYHKTFKALAADRSMPKLDHWKAEEITNEGKKAIKITFDKKMDYASTIGAFHIDGLNGSWSILDGENAIQFTTDLPIPRGNYVIEVNPLIEDLAGNNLLRLFDKEIGKKVQDSAARFALDVEIK